MFIFSASDLSIGGDVDLDRRRAIRGSYYLGGALTTKHARFASRIYYRIGGVGFRVIRRRKAL